MLKIVKSTSEALIYKDKKISYNSLINSVEVLSSRIKDAKDKSAIFLENRPEWVYSLFASWQNNITSVLIDVMSTAEEVAYVLKDSNPSIVFVSNQTLEVIEKAILESKLKISIINVDRIDFSESKSSEMIDFSTKDLDSTAVIIYTSGTTGDPKGVMLSFGNLYSNLKNLKDTKILSSKERVLALLFFHHSYPLMVTLLLPLSLGATVVISSGVSSEEIFSLLNKYKITVLIGVPRLFSLVSKGLIKQINSSKISKKIYSIMKHIKWTFLRKLVFKKAHQKFGGHIKLLVSGGAKLDVEAAEVLATCGFTVLEGYGLTETSPIISTCTPSHNKIGSVGKPLNGVKVLIKDNEILVKGDNIMKGYYNKEAETSEVIKDGWFHTGDLGSIDSDGYLHIVGRKKEMIVLSSGKNIDPSSIENNILKIIEGIKEIGIFENEGTLSAIVFPDLDYIRDKKILNIDEYIKWQFYDCYNSKVADYKRINSYYIVKNELPKTRLGKIKRFMLPDLIVSKDITHEEHPVNEVYDIIKSYIEDITKKDVYPSSHIEIDLGLDSIDKVDLQNFIELVFGINVKAEEMADMMEIDKFYRYVDKNKQFINIKNLHDKALASSISKDIELSKPNVPLIKIASKIFKSTFKMLFKMRAEGLENIPTDKNFILAPNHQSFLDVYLLSAVIPVDLTQNIYSLAYYGNFQGKFMKKLAKNINVISVDIDKNLREVISTLEYVLEQKKSLLIFPEGSITRDGSLSDFKPMLTLLSKKKNVPVIPVTIHGANIALPYGKSIPKRAEITLSFLKPVYPENFKTHKDMSEHIKHKISKELERMNNDK
jgi:long-chain acyl-CoA synthetase